MTQEETRIAIVQAVESMCFGSTLPQQLTAEQLAYLFFLIARIYMLSPELFKAITDVTSQVMIMSDENSPSKH